MEVSIGALAGMVPMAMAGMWVEGMAWVSARVVRGERAYEAGKLEVSCWSFEAERPSMYIGE